jgi:twitching motility protein PilT
MNLEALIESAKAQGASDLHLEPGLPAAMRVRGGLRVFDEPLNAPTLLEIARDMIGPDEWPQFVERRSFDLSKTIAGVRCRINVLHSSRGVGFAIRLLGSFQAKIDKLNLHSDLKKLVNHSTGLILVSGPTGSGKSSTLAALIQEINLNDARHILTIESPIEYGFRPHRAYIRQREVGRDTPSFEQALLDALREDPDVLMVGEMRDPETMRLTLNASETGHLVLATVHSSNCVEALQRIVSAFPAEIQNNVAAQLADSLVAVISQRLQFRPDLQMRIPECEILIPTNPVKNFIRNRDFYKIMSVLETGADHGMWTFPRYRNWLEKRTQWYVPKKSDENMDAEVQRPRPIRLPPAGKPSLTRVPSSNPAKLSGAKSGESSSIEIEPVEGGLEDLLRRLS